MKHERRRKYFINKPLQLRYMAVLSLSLGAISAVLLLSLYFGIWGGVLDAFSDRQVREELLTASRLTEYEQARLPGPVQKRAELKFFQQAERLSQRQKEVLKGVLDQTHRRLVPLLIGIMILIAWGSVYLSHKIAGPFYHFDQVFRRLGQRDLKARMRLRAGDEGLEIAEQFNRSVERLELSLLHVKHILREHPDDPETLKKLLKEELDKIKTRVDA